MSTAAKPGEETLEEAIIRQARESFQRLPALEMIIDRLLLSLVPDMKSYCTLTPEIELASLEYMHYEDAIDTVVAPSPILIAEADPWDSQIACVIETDLLFSVLEIMLGGRQAPQNTWKPRNLSAIEQKLGRSLAELTLRSLSGCFAEIDPVSFQTHALESNPKSVILAAPRTATLHVRLSVQFEERSGHITLILPYGTLDDLTTKMSQPYLGGRTAVDSSARAEMNNQLSSTSVTITGVLQQIEVPMRDVLNWKVGDVIDLGMNVDTPVLGVVNEQPMFQASFGQRSNGALALRVIQSLLPQNTRKEITDASGND